MSVEFRQRTPGEYARIVWKRKWLIILPALAIASAVAIVVWKLPDVYQSTTLLVVKPPTFAQNFVPTVSDDALSSRLQSITQIVTSRSKLEPLILKYNLYNLERVRGESMDGIVALMRTRDITVDLDKSARDNIPAFRISYKERDPKATQAVTGELASLYVSANKNEAINNGTTAKNFFQQQLDQAKSELDTIDHQRIAYMTAHVDSMPTTVQSLLGQLTGLRDQQKTLTSEIGRLRDSRTALSNSLNDLMSQSQIDKGDIIEQQTDVKGTLAYGQLIQRKASLDAELQGMKKTLRAKNPDMITKQAELDAIQKQMDQMVAENQAKTEQIKKKIQDRPDFRINGLKTNLQLTTGELAREEKQLDQATAQIAVIESRINSVPGSEVALQALDNDYKTKKTAYDSLLEKKSKIDLSSDASTNEQGETIQVIDPASLPQTPIAPKRPMLIALGLALGLGFGFALAALFEVPRLLTIQTTEDAAHYTGLPVLASVPELLTAQEARRIPQRRLLLLVAGIAITILSIPALALALKATHIFDRFVS